MTIGRIPLYGALKGFAARLSEIDEGSTFRPAILVVGDGERELGYLAEGHGDGNATVKPPLAPTPFSGSTEIVSMRPVKMRDASLGDFTRVLSHWGIGACELIGRAGGAVHDRNERCP